MEMKISRNSQCIISMYHLDIDRENQSYKFANKIFHFSGKLRKVSQEPSFGAIGQTSVEEPA